MLLHSEMEQSATLFAMKDCYKKAFLSTKAKSYEKSGMPPEIAHKLADDDWKEALEDNEHFGNTVTFFGDAEDFIKELSFKIFFLESRLSSSRGFSKMKVVADRYAATL